MTPNGAALFRVNGKRILVRGGGWAPDMFFGPQPERQDAQLNYALDMHLNTIRLEGNYEDDRFWQLSQEIGWPVNLHVSMVTEPPGLHKSKLVGDVRFYDAPTRMIQFIFSGVFERFPRLVLGLVEVDCGWVPYFREQADDRYKRLHRSTGVQLPRRPSEYFYSNMYFTYITDHYGIENRHKVGVDNILWSSDYPHVGADWPNSRATIDRDFAEVQAAERHKILAGNAVRLFHL